MNSKFWQKHTYVNKIDEYLVIIAIATVEHKTKLSVFKEKNFAFENHCRHYWKKWTFDGLRRQKYLGSLSEIPRISIDSAFKGSKLLLSCLSLVWVVYYSFLKRKRCSEKIAFPKVLETIRDEFTKQMKVSHWKLKLWTRQLRNELGEVEGKGGKPALVKFTAN